MKHGYVQIYTGDGKGKTTAAMGVCLRAAGAGLKVYLAQFLKMSDTSEINALKKFRTVEIHQFGSGKFVKGKPSAADLLNCANGFLKVTDAVVSGIYDLVIADELCVAVDLGMITTRSVLDLMHAKPPGVELIITGRNASPELVKQADLVTEMTKKKHYFDKGVPARRGIEL